MDVGAFRQQTFATPLAPPRESGPPGFGAHTSSKSVLVFPGALGALECAFHDVTFSGGATLGRHVALSIPAHDPDRAPDPSGKSKSSPKIKSKIRIMSRNKGNPHCQNQAFVE
jgi:hypothetical protein